MPEEISTAEVMQKLALSLKSIKEELSAWHQESKQNQIAIAALTKRLDMLSQKTAVSPEIRNELASIKAEIGAISMQPAVGGSQEARAMLENQLAKINRELIQIKSIQMRMEELSSKSDEGDKKIEEQVRSLKSELERLPRETPSTDQIGKDFLPALQKDLEEWHNESVSNTREITQLLQRLQAIESKTGVGEKVKSDLERVMAQLERTSSSISNFEELKKTLDDHADELKEIYSTLGKERVELDSVNGTIVSLQSKLMEWGARNRESLEEVEEIKRGIAHLSKELKSKDVGDKVEDISSNLHDLADRVESLHRQETQLRKMQEQLVEFDQGLKELVKKAVIASMSKKEFEKELEMLESNPANAPPISRLDDKPFPPAAKPSPKKQEAKPPEPKDVRAKMRELRAALESEGENAGLMEKFSEFEREMNTATSEDDKKMLWENLHRDITESFKESVTKAKKKIEAGKASGADTSKLNLLVAKTDIGLVSLETSIALRNIVKAKEIIQKLSDLKSQMGLLLD